jgi:hypothetical protein
MKIIKQIILIMIIVGSLSNFTYASINEQVEKQVEKRDSKKCDIAKNVINKKQELVSKNDKQKVQKDRIINTLTKLQGISNEENKIIIKSKIEQIESKYKEIVNLQNNIKQDLEDLEINACDKNKDNKESKENKQIRQRIKADNVELNQKIKNLKSLLQKDLKKFVNNL